MIPVELSAFANHLWQSSLFAVAAPLLTLALRHNRAQVRYRLWLAASIKFLIPFSLLLSAGSRLEWRAAQTVAPPLASAIAQISQPFTAPLPALAMPAGPAVPSLLPALLALVWLCGCAGVFFRWWVRWRRVRIAVRSASRLPIEAPVRVMSSPAPLEPGVFGVFRPVLLLPEGIANRLTPAQFRAILAHEFCHVRRRDHQAAAIHMVVEAVFWFHPLVWWIGARLVEERERACDEEVLRLGSEPEVYAAGILNVCRFCLESPLACAPGVTGADLKQRIEAIMTRRTLHSLTLARKLLLAVVGVGAIAGPIVVGMFQQSRAQGQGAAPLRFEVASIKRAKGAGGRGGLDILPGGGLRMDGATLKQLIAFAYDLRESQVSGGPRWIASDAYNILAKAERAAPADNPQTTVAPGTTAWDRVRQRTQVLLAERFQLVIRKDAKAAAGYELRLAKGGPKVQPSPDQGNPRTLRSRGRIDAQRGTMQMLAVVLSEFVGRPVVDRTGLTGTYDYKVEYTPEAGPTGAPSENAAGADSPDLAGPSVFAALQEQLGLKLEPARVGTETIVVVRAEKPSAN